MNTFKKFVRKNLFYLLAFFVPFIVLLAAYIAMGIFPFGNRGVQIIDSYHQYAPFFSELYRKIWSGDSLFYSWNGGLGMNFWAIFAYYLVSPLNIIMLIFPRGLLLEAFTLILMLKVSLSGLFFAYYIRHRFKRYNISIVYFALFYALSGWVIGYNWNIMWLDCIMLFPLIILGLERLVKEGRGLLYGITLGLAIICNYYIAIMICIFVVLYFFVLFFEQKKKSVVLFFKRGFSFAGYSLLAGGMSAVLLLPTLINLAASNSAESDFPTNIKFYHSVIELFSQQFAFVEPTDLSGMPNMYFGVFTLMMVILYLFHRGISLRAKLMKLGLLGFLVFSTNFRILDYIWHGFHFPNSLPGRFTFIYAFLALSMAYEVVTALRKFRIWQYLLAFLVPAAGVFLAWRSEETSHEFYTYLITAILLVLYLIYLFLVKLSPRKRKLWQIVLLCLLVIEAAGNGIFGLCMNGSISRTSYNEDIKETAQIKKETETLTNGGFYRMELDKFSPRNQNMWLDLPGFSLFSSTMNADLNDLTGNLGFFSATNKYSYVGATPITDSIFGIRYLVSEGEPITTRTFRLKEDFDARKLYENPFALSLGFMVNERYQDWNTQVSNPEYVLNDFVQKAANMTEPVFVSETLPAFESTGMQVSQTTAGLYEYTLDEDLEGDATMTFNFELDGEKTWYVYYEASNCSKVRLTSGEVNQNYSDTRGHMIELGKEEMTELKFTAEADKSTGKVKLYLYSFDEAAFLKFYQTVSKSQWQLTTYESTHLKGTIQVQETGIMFTSIPYDKGWTVKVDGVKVEPQTVDGALLHIPLEAGEHEVEMYYIPQGFIPGLAVTILCVLIVVLLIFRQFRERKKVVVELKSLQNEEADVMEN